MTITLIGSGTIAFRFYTAVQIHANHVLNISVDQCFSIEMGGTGEMYVLQ